MIETGGKHVNSERDLREELMTLRQDLYGCFTEFCADPSAANRKALDYALLSYQQVFAEALVARRWEQGERG